jgi:2-dehydropantoate 2-reductase
VNQPTHVVGAGGIGVALAWCLARAGGVVTLVDAHPGKIATGQAAGVTVVGHPTYRLPFVRFDDWTPPADGWVLLCTKTYDNSTVLSRLRDTAHLVPVQNGFDPALDRLDHPGEGIASFVSECRRDRPVTRITRPGSLHLGPRRDVGAAERAELASLAATLRKGGLFTVKSVTDVRPYKAAKLMYNAAISPLAAAAGVDNAELLTDPLARRLFFGLLRENYAILRHAQISLERVGPFHPDTVARILRVPILSRLMAVFFRPSLRNTYCSMTPDISSGRTEIEAYNGHLIRLADDFPCPLNRSAVALIERIVRERLPPRRAHLRDFAASLPEGNLP